MNRKVYFIQPTYRNADGRLLKGHKLLYSALALPALSAAVPPDWDKSFCFEYLDEVDYDTEASVVGISTMGYDLLHGAEIAAEFKRRGRAVIFGGPQAELCRERLCAAGYTVVTGHPGPRELAGILGDAEGGRLAPLYRAGFHVDFPFDYSVLAGKPIRFMPVLTSVGCRGTCSFCSTAAIYKGNYRLRPIEAVLADLRAACRVVPRVVMADANIYNNRGYLARLFARVAAEGLRFRWAAQATIDIGDDIETLSLLKQSGCVMLIVGVESLSQKNLDDLGKGDPVERHRSRLARIREAGISVGGYFLLGLDEDGPQDFDRLFRFIRETRIDLPVLNLLIPVPGTRAAERLRRAGRLLVADDEELLRMNESFATSNSHCYYWPRRMTPDEVEDRYLDLYRRLTSVREVLRRSLHPDPRMAAVLFLVNRAMRRSFGAMRRSCLRSRRERDATARPGIRSSACLRPGAS